MKILHTADWHLGHRLHEQSQQEEQTMFLDWLKELIDEQKVDVLLVSGDVFDTGVPSSQSQKLYYSFLASLGSTHCTHVIVTGGNHDSPGTLNAPKEILNALNIKVVGKATDNIEDEVFTLQVNDESIVVAAVPYLRDQDIRRAVEGESFDEITLRYKQALINHYTSAAHCCQEKLQGEKMPVIAMGHLFAIGGKISESEQSIYVGSLGHIGADDFPETFDYIALGHLHRPQVVGNKNHIRYSGSPNILSFSEVGYDKQVLLVETNPTEISQIKEITVPKFRAVEKIKGNLEQCIEQLQALKPTGELTPWVEVILDNDSNTTLGFDTIHQAVEALDLKVLKVTLKNQREITGLEQLAQNTQHIKELTPMEVFRMKCEEQGFDLDQNSEILDAFSEVLQIARDS